MSHLTRRCAFAVVVLAAAVTAQAHVPASVPGEGGGRLWIAALLGTALLLYAAGLRAIWQRTHQRREHAWRAVAFAAGCAALAALLLGPIDEYAPRSFSIHMVQHEGLMLIAAPLLVLGRALPLFVWALPERARRAVVALTHARGMRAGWGLLTAPLAAWLMHAAALWLWHAPPAFDAALRSPALHEWQHFSFLASALLFWHALLRRQSQGAQGAAIVYLFTTTIHTGVLGALLALARTPYYASMRPGLSPWFCLSTLEDQQLGGLIMWVPGALVYVGVALWLAARWIGAPRPVRSAG